MSDYTRRLTEDEWNALARTADEALALATVFDTGLLYGIEGASERRTVLGGCASALHRTLASLVADLNELEPILQ